MVKDFFIFIFFVFRLRTRYESNPSAQGARPESGDHSGADAGVSGIANFFCEENQTETLKNSDLLRASLFCSKAHCLQIELILFFKHFFCISSRRPFIPPPLKKIQLPLKTRSKCTLLSQHNAAQTFQISLRDNNACRHSVTNSTSVHAIWKWMEIHAFSQQ